MITVATYNILHGHYSDLILENIKTLIDAGAGVICLQEADPPFKILLDEFLKQPRYKNWRAHYAHQGPVSNLAVLWDGLTLEPQKFHDLLLPNLGHADLVQRLKRHTSIFQRGALVGNFLFRGKILRVTSAHLGWEGGVRHRLKQLAFLREFLDGSSADCDVVAGDFNTWAPAVFRGRQGNKVQKVLGAAYTNALPKLKWSCDLSYSVPQDGWGPVVKICRPLGIKLKSRLDYLFVRNLKVVSAEMLDLPGSDHRPLMARLGMK
jgi:endonuclease/exonuclease/phosphatase family metal-dependent hydrolase